jgi:ADP-ribosyl-[dinitrogen reductase] hydrolase
MNDAFHLDRALGCVIGLAVGDAVGTTIEFLPRGGYPPLTDMIGGGPFRLRPGQWTDDTSMALCLGESLLAYPELDPLDLMQRFLRWVEHGENSSTGSCFDIGQTTLTAISRFRRTGDPFAGSTHRNKAGNGSVMRLAPVAARWWSEPAKAEAIARRQSETTHGATESVDGCALLARVLCAGIAGNGLSSLVQDDPSWAPAIRDIGAGTWRSRQESEISSTGYVVHTLEAAFWAFEKSSSFEETILTAANLGHDSDTVAAVAGQIAGSVWGLSAIPDRWVERLHDGSRIKQLTQDLYTAGR